MNDMIRSKKILITGGAGFIGFHLSKKLLEQDIMVIGFDNLNAYYDVRLKHDRLKDLKMHKNYAFIEGDLAVLSELKAAFRVYKPDIVINLGAQAGVRYSIENPKAYMDSNVTGFFNVLECCRNSKQLTGKKIEHLIYASSSSVYGNQHKTPFSTNDNVDHPISLYAATKKSNELMAFTYSHLYDIPATGLRFFTVYGPFGRPDMAYFSFTDNIVNKKPLKVFNNGDMYRDFTYIDDIVRGIEHMLCTPPPPDMEHSGARHKVYNIGNNRPEKLMDFINILEAEIGIPAEIEFLPMQPGDVYQTYADVTELEKDFGFRPVTSLKDGLHEFVNWYKDYYKIT